MVGQDDRQNSKSLVSTGKKRKRKCRDKISITTNLVQPYNSSIGCITELAADIQYP